MPTPYTTFAADVISLANEFASLGGEIVAALTEQRALRELTVSADRKTTIMRLTIAGDFDEALEIVDITGDDFKTGMIEGIEEIKGLMQGLEDK